MYGYECHAKDGHAKIYHDRYFLHNTYKIAI